MLARIHTPFCTNWFTYLYEQMIALCKDSSGEFFNGDRHFQEQQQNNVNDVEEVAMQEYHTGISS